jgi:hypothetical protein
VVHPDAFHGLVANSDSEDANLNSNRDGVANPHRDAITNPDDDTHCDAVTDPNGDGVFDSDTAASDFHSHDDAL